MTTFRIREGLVVRSLPDGDAVVAGADEMEAVIVNVSAAALLELLAAPATEQTIWEVFCEAFPATDPRTIRQDISELIEHLLRVGVIEPCGAASSTV